MAEIRVFASCWRRAKSFRTVRALINYTTLIVIGLYLLYEAAIRFADPQDVEGWIIVVIAGIALIVDVMTAMLTYAMSKSSVNIRAAFLHNVADALGSVAVIFAGTLILLYDWRLIDPIVTVVIAGYILWQSTLPKEPRSKSMLLLKIFGNFQDNGHSSNPQHSSLRAPSGHSLQIA